MLTNTPHQAPDRRPSNSCDPEPHASPRYLTPYWSDTIAAFSNFLWLPNSTANHDSLINTTQSWDSKTAAHSWFSTNRIPAPDSELPKDLLVSRSSGLRHPRHRGATKQQTRRIQVYPESTQKLAIATWLTASRWTYNLTVEILQSGIPAVWKHIASMVMPEVKALHPEWDSVPYQVKRTAVRDACRAMSNVKTFNMELKDQPDTRPESRRNSSPNSATAAGRTPSSPATYRTTP